MGDFFLKINPLWTGLVTLAFLKPNFTFFQGNLGFFSRSLAKTFFPKKSWLFFGFFHSVLERAWQHLAGPGMAR